MDSAPQVDTENSPSSVHGSETSDPISEASDQQQQVDQQKPKFRADRSRREIDESDVALADGAAFEITQPVISWPHKDPAMPTAKSHPVQKQDAPRRLLPSLALNDEVLMREEKRLDDAWTATSRPGDRTADRTHREEMLLCDAAWSRVVVGWTKVAAVS